MVNLTKTQELTVKKIYALTKSSRNKKARLQEKIDALFVAMGEVDKEIAIFEAPILDWLGGMTVEEYMAAKEAEASASTEAETTTEVTSEEVVESEDTSISDDEEVTQATEVVEDVTEEVTEEVTEAESTDGGIEDASTTTEESTEIVF